MEEQNQAANGFKNVSVEGDNNIAPVMHDTLGVLFLGIISLVLLFELRRVYDLNRKLSGKKCACKCCQGEGCCCDCCKGEKCSCDCCHKGKEEADKKEETVQVEAGS